MEFHVQIIQNSCMTSRVTQKKNCQFIRHHHQSSDFSNSKNIFPQMQIPCNDTINNQNQFVKPKINIQYENQLEKNREKIQEIKLLILNSRNQNPLQIQKSQVKQQSIKEQKMMIELSKPIRNVSNFSHDSRQSTTTNQTTPLRSSSNDKQFSYMQMSKNHNSPLNKFKKIKYLGRGNISDVYSVIDTTTGMIAALKTIQKSLITSKGIQELIKTEIIIQSFISHQNILKCYGIINDEKQIALVLELGDITLYNYKKEKKLHEKQIIDIIYQVLKGVNFLHQNGIIHRDIKPENILLQNGIVKLADLGICVKATETNQYCGTPGYMAPEIIEKQKYDNKVDCYSIGVLLNELVFGKLPKIGQRINGDTQLINLMNHLLEVNPKNRFSCKQALEQDIFKLCERKAIKQSQMIKNTILWDC
ncbi:unnamed protein product [Paramecium primaurelia]|uniref:Protein kinase domain-containing protein n=1 Tax=Paramecium primaurelia TaxID=5886 RepID=A0A8S1LSB1_PARPR|nr:unnamed protein product [Paramecium primaurelia]